MSTLEKIEELKNQIKEMQDRLNKIENEAESENEDIPKIGDVYYYIDDTGNINSSIYQMTIEDEDRIKIGNYFKTKEEAEFESERLKVIAEMKKYARKFVKGEINYCVYYDYNGKSAVDYWTDVKSGLLYFDKENIKRCRETVGDDRIKKYYLMVEDE